MNTTPTRRLPLLLTLLLTLLLAFAIVGLLVLQRRNRAENSDPLQGDSETASAALSEVIAKTPADKRLPLLLRNITGAAPGLRYAAADELGKIKSPQAADALEMAFTDSSSVVRQRALEVLPNVDADRGLKLQLAGLRDEDLWIREAAIGQLALLPKRDPARARTLVPALIAALPDESETVSTSSAFMLSKITGNPWTIHLKTPPSERAAIRARWRQWWKQDGAKWQARAGVAAASDTPPVQPTRSDPAPDFDLNDVDGKPFTLAGQRGRVTLLNFYGTWCAPCQKETPDLVRLEKAFAGRNVDIVGLALSESDGANSLRRWCKAHDVVYRQALSTDAIQEAFGHIEEVPISVLLDAQGRIRYRWEGERDFATFSAAVTRLLNETPPPAR